jgi:hypothetical protein
MLDQLTVLGVAAPEAAGDATAPTRLAMDNAAVMATATTVIQS